MDRTQQFLIVGGLIGGGYLTFHGHRLGKDCWMCNYRGLGWILAIAWIVLADSLADYLEKKREALWEWDEDESDAGSDVSDDSSSTVKGNK